MEGEQLPSHMTFVFFVKMAGIVFGDPKAPLFNQGSPSGRTSGAKGPPVGGMMLFWDEKRLPNCLHGLFLREFPHVFF